MSYLLDTNVLSELRRGRKCDTRVRAWARSASREQHFISVLSLGEIRKGIESLRRKSPDRCPPFENWLDRLIADYEETILSISEEVADRWGRLNAERSQPVIDSLIAATALEYDLTVATRNTGDFPAEVKMVNPWNG